MKMLAVAAVLVLLVATGAFKFEFRWWTSSGASNIPAAKDVNRLQDAGAAKSLEASTQNLAHMLDGINMNTAAGAAVLEHQVPGVADRLAEQADELRLRLAAVRVDTPTGRLFRSVMTRGLLATRIMYRDFAAGAARHRTSRRAIRQWVQRYHVLQRWYAAQFQGVVQAAPPEDRAAVAAALSS